MNLKRADYFPFASGPDVSVPYQLCDGECAVRTLLSASLTAAEVSSCFRVMLDGVVPRDVAVVAEQSSSRHGADCGRLVALFCPCKYE